MAQDSSTVHRPPNPWDVLIGICFGAQLTCFGLRLAERVGAEIFIWGQLLFLAGIALQCTRQWQWHMRPDAQDRGSGREGVPSYIQAKQKTLDLLLGLFLGVQLTFLALMYADLLRGRITIWGNAAGMIFIALVVLRNRRLRDESKA